MFITKFNPEKVKGNFHKNRNISSLGFSSYTFKMGACWCLLKAKEKMVSHTHPAGVKGEIYAFLKGTGVMIIDGEEKKVREGDVVFIPEGAEHSLINDGERELLWYAFWK
jgi:mannose-6-phosphate isomerase-like protein (cupin superfamily)